MPGICLKTPKAMQGLRLVPKGPRSFSGCRATSPAADVRRLSGKSYRHPRGYVPVYKDLTDMPAFRRSIDDFGDRVMYCECPYGKRTKEDRNRRDSWIDGWLWAASLGVHFFTKLDVYTRKERESVAV